MTPDILDEARRIVSGERNADYGHPRDNHQATADMVTIYLQRRGMLRPGVWLTARDVCWFNILQKASRDAHYPKRDNLVDTAGYAQNAQWALTELGEPVVESDMDGDVVTLRQGLAQEHLT